MTKWLANLAVGFIAAANPPFVFVTIIACTLAFVNSTWAVHHPVSTVMGIHLLLTVFLAYLFRD